NISGYHWEIGKGIAVDSIGNAYITGETDSTNFPTAGNGIQSYPTDTCVFNGINGPQNIPCGNEFVSRLNLNTGGTALQFAYSTYLGGSANDLGYAIAVDSDRNAYVAGETDGSANFPTYRPLQASRGVATSQQCTIDAFVTKTDFPTTLGALDSTCGTDNACN